MDAEKRKVAVTKECYETGGSKKWMLKKSSVMRKSPRKS